MVAVVAALMPVNIVIEAYKLRAALPRELQSSWSDSIGQICGGIAVGLWTPIRIGEFAGRLAGTQAIQRAPIVAVTALGAVAQWSPLLIGGGVALQFWRQATAAYGEATASAYGSQLRSYLYGDAAFWIGVFSVGLGLATAALFWYSPQVVLWGRGVKLPRWLAPLVRRMGLSGLARVDVLETMERERTGLLAASAARYLIYLLQMSLAFMAFGLPVDLASALIGTATLLLLHGFLPVPPALQAVARIEFAVILFGYANPNEVSIATASLFIFALNLGLPALFGWLFIVRGNVKNDSLS